MTRDSPQAARARARALLAGPRNKQQQRADHLAALIAHVDTLQTLETTLGQTVSELIDLDLSPDEIADLTGLPREQIHHWAHGATPQGVQKEA